jgi:adenylate cyclase
LLKEVDTEKPLRSGRLRSGGEDYFITYRMLPGTQDWVVGIVVPRAFYLGKLATIQRELMLVSLAVMAVLIGAGIFVLRGVNRAQAQIVRETQKMRALEFAPSSTCSTFSDVQEVLESLEQAKTAVRAMGKYVPIDLVRRLYLAESEPMLGGELMEISVMFTDIKSFTSLSEQLGPDELATALGDYLHVMAGVIHHECRGTIDKYIGDAIMTIWNAPEPVPDHPRLACRAALQARAAAQALMTTPAWGARPVFETRFGLHFDSAFVGHFGSPDRLSYTAIGNGINLASRLEGLNKLYGTTIIASEAMRQQVAGHFSFRLLDLVAVKGKEEAVRIHELLGEAGTPSASERFVAGYEAAFHACLARDFAGAAALLRAQSEEDPPSRVLLARCLAYEVTPPPPDWQGVHIATEK